MDNQDLYFKNVASKYMFALTEVGGGKYNLIY